MLFFWCGKGPGYKAKQKRQKKIAVILSKEARCFVVFWCGKGPGYKAKKNAPSFYFAAIRSFNSIEVPSSRGGRSEAQHNPPRCSHLLPACWAASCRKTSPKGFRTDKVSSLGACTHRPFAKVPKTLVKPHFWVPNRCFP